MTFKAKFEFEVYNETEAKEVSEALEKIREKYMPKFYDEDSISTKNEVTDKALKTIKEADKGDRILWDEKEGVVKNLDKIDIHSQNKELLDKDYAKTNLGVKK